MFACGLLSPTLTHYIFLLVGQPTAQFTQNNLSTRLQFQTCRLLHRILQ